VGLIFQIHVHNGSVKNKNIEISPVRLYSTKEVESMWGISRWRIYGLVNAGKISPIVNMGRGWKWDGSEFNKELLERL
jgi:predicted DNA-binding transcriptional regulator AlpA